MTKNYWKLLVFIGTTLAALTVSGGAVAEEAPDVLVKRITAEVMETATTDKEIKAGNRKRIRALVDEKILPYTDFRRATALAVGRHWNNATPAQQQQLIDEFRSLMMHTYAGALSQIRDEKLEYRPLRDDPSDGEVEIHFRVLRPRRGEPVDVSYRMYESPEGWKVYDVNVLGAWLTQTYRNSFSDEIARGGIDGLISVLAAKNKKLAAQTASVGNRSRSTDQPMPRNATLLQQGG